MKKTLGTMIAELRQQHGMTQLELAEKMGVTDKAVSKWERDLSCPDINSIPNLAEILRVSVEELMQVKKEAETPVSKVAEIMEIAPKAVAMAMGIAVTVLTILNALDVKSGMVMLGIGLACVGIHLMNDKKYSYIAAMHLKCMAVLHLKTVVPNDNHSCPAVRSFRMANWWVR